MKKRERTPLSQKDKFKQAAKEHGCDESQSAFNAKLKKLVKPEKAKKPRGKK